MDPARTPRERPIRGAGRESRQERDAGNETSEAWTLRRLEVQQPCADRAGCDARSDPLQNPCGVQRTDAARDDERHHAGYLDDERQHHDRAPAEMVRESAGGQQRNERAGGVHRVDRGHRGRGEVVQLRVRPVQGRGRASREKEESEQNGEEPERGLGSCGPHQGRFAPGYIDRIERAMSSIAALRGMSR